MNQIEAATFGDIVIVAIPLAAYQSVPSAPLAGKIVIDANNYYPERDGRISELDRQLSTTSELLAQHLASSRVIKAFNAIAMNDLEKDGLPASAQNRRALPIAGDDQEGKRIAAALLDAFGFDSVDVGPLAEGWRFERSTPVYCIPLTKKELIVALAAIKRLGGAEAQQ